MKGDIRCVEGRLMRHDPQPDDPDLETDRGPCPECSPKDAAQFRTLPDPHDICALKAELRQSLEDFSNSQTPVGGAVHIS